MSKAEFKRAVVAALLGALVTFLTHLAESLTGIQKEYSANILGGLGASFAYLKMSIKTLV